MTFRSRTLYQLSYNGLSQKLYCSLVDGGGFEPP